MKSIVSSLIVAAALASSVAAFAQTPAPATATVKLSAENNSGETGTVTLAGNDAPADSHSQGYLRKARPHAALSANHGPERQLGNDPEEREAQSIGNRRLRNKRSQVDDGYRDLRCLRRHSQDLNDAGPARAAWSRVRDEVCIGSGLKHDVSSLPGLVVDQAPFMPGSRVVHCKQHVAWLNRERLAVARREFEDSG
jgi:hypothetical protein